MRWVTIKSIFDSSILHKEANLLASFAEIPGKKPRHPEQSEG